MPVVSGANRVEVCRVVARFPGGGNRACRRGALFILAPEVAVAQDPFDHIGLPRLVDQGDYLHCSPAIGALQGINFVHQFYQGCPGQTKPELLLGQNLLGAGNQR